VVLSGIFLRGCFGSLAQAAPNFRRIFVIAFLANWFQINLMELGFLIHLLIADGAGEVVHAPRFVQRSEHWNTNENTASYFGSTDLIHNRVAPGRFCAQVSTIDLSSLGRQRLSVFSSFRCSPRLCCFKVIPAMHTSQFIQKFKNLFKNLKVWEITTLGEQSLELFFVRLDV